MHPKRRCPYSREPPVPSVAAMFRIAREHLYIHWCRAGLRAYNLPACRIQIHYRGTSLMRNNPS